MEDLSRFSLPFVIRDMIKTGKSHKLEIIVTSQAFAAATVKIRLVSQDGISKFMHTNVGNGIPNSSIFQITDIPVYLSAINDDALLRQGDIYVTVSLRLDGEIVTQLCSGFVYKQKGISWPVSNSVDVNPGKGDIRWVAGVNAAAGAEAQDTVPAGELWRIISARVSFVTDATVASRRVHFIFDSFVTGQMRFWGNTDQTATQTMVYNLSNLGVVQSETNSGMIAINISPEIYVPSGGVCGTLTTNIQAGDNFAAISYQIESFFTET
jgi:hypothetical protein